ncbi:MAG: hypothetical protein KGL32_07460, partial [candidate division NC10 bacterium]|nr:hypothetical protein [candidate division NC10 bacterium]
VFHGRSDSLEFATLPQSYGAEPFSHMIRIVAYAIESDRGLTAMASYPLVTQTSGLVEDQAKSLDERVSEVRFRYLVPEGKPDDKLPPTWRDAWDPSRDETPQFPSRGSVSSPGRRALKGSDRLPLSVEVTLTIRQQRAQDVRELILPPLVFPVQVGRTL